jgi:hypothetical protein
MPPVDRLKKGSVAVVPERVPELEVVCDVPELELEEVAVVGATRFK